MAARRARPARPSEGAVFALGGRNHRTQVIVKHSVPGGGAVAGRGVTCGELIASVSEPMAAAVATKLVLTDLVRTLALDRECRARVLRE